MRLSHYSKAVHGNVARLILWNILDACLKSLQIELHGRVHAILDVPDLKTAELRKSIDGLAILVKEGLNLDPFSLSPCILQPAAR